MTSLRIHAFGGFRAYRDDGPDSDLALIGDFPTRKAESLFCYLVLNRHRFHLREMLADLFWSEGGSKNAKGSLSTAIWRLRRVLEDHGIEPGTYLLVEREQIRFNSESDYWFDVEEFETRVGGHHIADEEDESLRTAHYSSLREAAELYRGDFLEGLYDDWCIYERERLQQMFLRALARLMVHSGTKGQYEEGIACGQRILSLDPLREEVHRELMRYHQLAGRRACALRQFEVCRSVLREELDIEPMPETIALYRMIREHRWVEGTPLRAGTGTVRPTGVLTSQMNHALSQLRLALEMFDEAKRQLSQAVATMENAGVNIDYEV